MTITITPGAVFALALAVLIVQWVWNSFDIGLDDSDLNGKNRSNLAVHTDYKTGLQYLRAPGGGITPRLNADGTHMRKEVGQ